MKPGDKAIYLEVKISAENPQQARDILRPLLDKRLVTGGQIIESPAQFLWKGSIIDMPNYCTIWSYTTAEHKQVIVDSVKAVSAEDFPMVWFTAIDGNEELLTWIKETLV